MDNRRPNAYMQLTGCSAHKKPNPWPLQPLIQFQMDLGPNYMCTPEPDPPYTCGR